MKQHFVRNVDLTAEIIRCQATMIVSNKLAKMLWLMVERYAMRPNWRQYSFLDDMKSDAILQLVKCNEPKRHGGSNDYRPNILKFDIGYSARAGTLPNPFAYATQIISNCFRRTVKVEGALQRHRDDCLLQARRNPSNKRQYEDDVGRSAEPIIPQKPKRTGPRTKTATNRPGTTAS